MLDAVIDSIVQILSAGGINAVKKYPVDVLDCSKKTVCVSLRSAKITASGCGNYIGLTAENGSIKEMLGSRGQLRIGLDIYSPSPNCDLLKEQTLRRERSATTAKRRCIAANAPSAPRPVLSDS